ncbi:hypothetical protein [Amycolatopsis alkalitolerans]|nr:hypothetical protein [Amycolatopsis alkalitolerans]
MLQVPAEVDAAVTEQLGRAAGLGYPALLDILIDTALQAAGSPVYPV